MNSTTFVNKFTLHSSWQQKQTIRKNGSSTCAQQIVSSTHSISAALYDKQFEFCMHWKGN